MTNDHILNIKKMWKTVKKKYGTDASMFISLPMIYSNSSTDAESVAKELSRFLYTEKIMEKTNPGHEDFLCFSAAFTAHNNKNFPAVQDLYYHVKNAGSYYGSYRGIILINVSEWDGHYRDKYFDIFLSYLADQRENGLIPFFYADCGSSKSDILALEAVISSYFIIVRINIGVPELYQYAVSVLTAQDIMLEESACLYLKEFIRTSSRSVLFHGTEAVRHICEGVACQSRPERSQVSLDGTRLNKIITDLGYGTIYQEKSEKTIGFR